MPLVACHTNILFAAVFALLLPLTATLNESKAESPGNPIRGLDLLALQHKDWPCQETLNGLSKGDSPLAIGILWETFGEDTRCLRRILALDRPLLVRVHLFNSVCVRNRNCGDYEPLAGYSTRSLRRSLVRRDPALIYLLRERAEEVESFLLRHSKGEEFACAISGFLEHNLTPEAATVVARELEETLSTCKVVDNPVNSQLRGNYQVPLGAILEVHHFEPPISPQAPCIVSIDGDTEFNGSVDDIAQKFPQCIAVFGWKQSYNCRAFGEFVDPRARNSCPKGE